MHSVSNVVLVTGDFQHPEFEALQGLDANTIFVADVRDAILFAISASRVDIVVLAQSRRNQFDTAMVNTLLNTSPLSTCISLVGSWCEGETRSGDPYRGWTRVYWNGAGTKFNSLLGESGLNPVRTNTTADRLLTATPSINGVNSSCEKPGATVGASVRCTSDFELLQHVARYFGFETVRIDPGSRSEADLDVVFVDGDSFDEAFSKRISKLAQDYPDSKIVPILGFVRQQDLRAALDLGVGQLITKPCELLQFESVFGQLAESVKEVAR